MYKYQIRGSALAFCICILSTPTWAQAAPGLSSDARQAALEHRALKVLASPEVQSAQSRVEDLLRNDLRAGALPPEAIVRAAKEIALGQVMTTINTDLADPFPFRFYALDHRLGAQHVSASKYAMSNPDGVFRYFPVDSKGRYRVVGQFPKRRPSYASFHLTGIQPGSQGSSKELAHVLDRDLQIGPQGRFVLTLGPAGEVGSGPNYIAMPPSTNRVIVRDTLGDWGREMPMRLSVERLERTSETTSSDPELIAAATAAIDRAAPTILAFRDRNFYQGPVNTLPQPGEHSAGDWALTSTGAFELEPSEALVFTLDLLGAKYMGVQLANVATGTLEADRRTSSLNDRQAIHNPDGTITFILSPKDPGFANWLDADGQTVGLIFVRWQGLLQGPLVQKPGVISFKVLPIAELSGAVKLPRVTPTQRHRDRAVRLKTYARRFE